MPLEYEALTWCAGAFQQMMDMYFDTPNKKWDLALYQEIFQVLIKYNDRIGVETFWEMMREMQVEPDEELRDKVLLIHSLVYCNKLCHVGRCFHNFVIRAEQDFAI